MSGSGISWAVCKSAPHSRQITMPAPHYSFLQAGCPSCRRTNSVKALQANRGQYLQFTNHCHHFHNSRNTITICQNTKGTRWPQPQKNYPLASSFLGPTNYLLREAFKILKVRLLWAVWLCLVLNNNFLLLSLCNKFQWKLNNSKTIICMLTIWL